MPRTFIITQASALDVGVVEASQLFRAVGVANRTISRHILALECSDHQIDRHGFQYMFSGDLLVNTFLSIWRSVVMTLIERKGPETDSPVARKKKKPECATLCCWV